MWPDTWRAVGTGVPGAGTLRGRDAVLQFLGKIRGLFVPGQMDGQVLHMVVEGGWAAAETRVSAAMRDGRRYENRYAFFIQVMNRKVWRRCHTQRRKLL
jgi:ketosteroid isomerase-like protein